jgi:hypothetical protein
MSTLQKLPEAAETVRTEFGRRSPTPGFHGAGAGLRGVVMMMVMMVMV